jgi:hypothetical protein
MMITIAALAVFLGLLNLAMRYDDTLILPTTVVMLGAFALCCRVFPAGQRADSKPDRPDLSGETEKV